MAVLKLVFEIVNFNYVLLTQRYCVDYCSRYSINKFKIEETLQ